jgi:uncharacterized protein
MSSKRLRVSLVACLALSTLASCAKPAEKVVLQVADQTLSVEVARTDAERERGLMGRKDLGPRNGMIFVFEREEHLTFWMKDTPTALSIAFISTDGTILQIEDMIPFSLKIIRSTRAARYALEMRQGAFTDLGIGVGAVISFPPSFP